MLRLSLLGKAGQQQLQGMQHSAMRTRRGTLECKSDLATMCAPASMQPHWQQQPETHLANANRQLLLRQTGKLSEQQQAYHL